MAYRKYTAKKMKSELALELRQVELFANLSIADIEPTSRLIENLRVGRQMALTTEKAVCEHLISPILTEIQLRNTGIILFSGEQLNVDSSRNLNGEIDFLFTQTTNFLEI